MSTVFNPFDPIQEKKMSVFLLFLHVGQALASVVVLVTDFSFQVQTSFGSLSQLDNTVLTVFIGLVLFASSWSAYLVLQRWFYRNFYFHSKRNGIVYKFVRWPGTKVLFWLLLTLNVLALVVFIYSQRSLYDKVYKFWFQIGILMLTAYGTLYSNLDAWNEVESVQNTSGTKYVEDPDRNWLRHAFFPAWSDGNPWRSKVFALLYLITVAIFVLAFVALISIYESIDNSMLNKVCLMQPIPSPTARI